MGQNPGTLHYLMAGWLMDRCSPSQMEISINGGYPQMGGLWVIHL